MNALVIYDSQYGNTEKIAMAIGDALGTSGDVQVLHVELVKPMHLVELDLLVVGSPTQSFHATTAITKMLKELPAKSLMGLKTAAFDTRFPESEIKKIRALSFFVRLWGRAAFADKHIADLLKKKGGEAMVPSEGFYVGGIEGPLMEGELERARNWAQQLYALASHQP
ncbi:MAG TPA: flavodoxin family protein [Anaerolineae bacterium]|nr:flavodoxin family protein [Anaerolineae bacterium]